MNLKTYQAKTMSDALAEVKQDLGRDAVILHARSFRKGGLLGIGGRSMWEITASRNINVPARTPSGEYVPSGPADDVAASAWLKPAAVRPGRSAVPQGGERQGVAAWSSPGSPGPLTEQVSELRTMVQSMCVQHGGTNGVALPASLMRLQTYLREQDVAPELATGLINELQMNLTGRELSDEGVLRSRILELIAGKISVARDEPISSAVLRGRIIALIGPTGVGKTTTIAKLAANLKLHEGKRVGLVTIDTYRVAAIDQLKTYADIIEVPLRIVMTPPELRQAIYAMRGLDVVLIDTAGRSQNDQLRLNRLRSFLSAAEADEIHLVVAATANRRCATSIMERFMPLGVNRLIVTKLDEAGAFGVVLNVAAGCEAPLSYTAAGQEVPDDIAAAEAKKLAAMVLGGLDDAE